MPEAKTPPLTKQQRDYLTIVQGRRTSMGYDEAGDIFQKRWGFRPTHFQIRDNTRKRKAEIEKLRGDRVAFTKEAMRIGLLDMACEVEQLFMLNRLVHDCVDGYDDEEVTKDGVVHYTKKDYSSAIRAMREIREVKAQFLRTLKAEGVPHEMRVRILSGGLDAPNPEPEGESGDDGSD